jgi:hypothetical protein
MEALQIYAEKEAIDKDKDTDVINILLDDSF